MKKKIDFYKKPLLITIIVILLQTCIYMLCISFDKTPTLIGNNIDNKIPFNIYFIVPYIIWYVLNIIMPLTFYKNNKKDFIKYLIAYITTSLIADIIFIIYPTTIIRPAVNPNDSILHLITHIIFTIDTPIENCFPSLHCAISFIWILFILEKNKYNLQTKIVTMLTSLLIVLSTLFIKQHVFIDVIGGLIIALIGYFITIKYIIKYSNNKL